MNESEPRASVCVYRGHRSEREPVSTPCAVYSGRERCVSIALKSNARAAGGIVVVCGTYTYGC